MLLVVCSHVELFMLGKPFFSWNELFGEFRMPLFFFVSGFVFYKPNVVYTVHKMKTLLQNKVFVQVFSPLLFLFLYCKVRNIDFSLSITSAAKSGYWFTFVLFEFFIIYCFIHRLLQRAFLKRYMRDILWMAIGITLYLLTAIGHQYIEDHISGFLAIEKLPYILFFILGTRVRKNWAIMEALLDSKYGVAVSMFVFISLNVFGDGFRQLPLGGVTWVIVTAISGIFLTVAFFRHFTDIFSSTVMMGRIMQYIGKRTLDIYLLHYFFMEPLSTYEILNFSDSRLSFLHFVICICLSVLVMAGCLFLSNVLRTSPFLGHYLFGVKVKS